MPISPRILLALPLILLTGCQAAYFGVLNAAHARPDVTRQHIEYDSRHSLGMDVYRSSSVPADAAVLVFFHGGSWRTGEIAWYRFVGEALAAEGMIVVVPEYRKYPDVQFPAFVEDAAQAVHYARAHAADWGGNPDRLFIAGHSAGAHIAGLLATDAHYLRRHSMTPGALAGFIGLAGPYDFAPITAASLRAIFPDRANEAGTQPIHFVDGDEPPMLLLHGSDDRRVWPRNSEHLAERLRAQQRAVELVILPGVSHSGILTALADMDADAVPSRRLLVDFVRAHSR